MRSDMNIAICENEKYQTNQIYNYVREWSQKNNVNTNIQCFNSGESFLFEWENNKNYDVIFLDITMNKISGIDVSNIVREKDKEVSIIFITATASYALHGYNVGALQYLLKPLDKNKLFECLDLVSKNRIINKDNFILLESYKKTFKLDCSSIIYCAMYYPNVHIFTTKDMIEAKIKFTHLEELLSNKGFIRPHRSYLVNLEHVHMIDNNHLILNNNDKIPISRLKIKEVNRKFIEYFSN